MKRENARIERRYAALCLERDEVKLALASGGLSAQDVTESLQFREDVVEGLNNPTVDNKRRNLELLSVDVRVKKGKAHVSCIIPNTGKSFNIHTLTSM